MVIITRHLALNMRTFTQHNALTRTLVAIWLIRFDESHPSAPDEGTSSMQERQCENYHRIINKLLSEALPDILYCSPFEQEHSLTSVLTESLEGLRNFDASENMMYMNCGGLNRFGK